MLNQPIILKVIPHRDFSLNLKLSDSRELKLDMLPLIKYPCYRKLSNLGLFFQVKCDDDIIYWDDMHDMHIDQILEFGKFMSNG